VRAWLYRIATNRCLNALRDRARRPPEIQAMVEPPEPTRRTEPIWLEPYPDVLLEDIPDRSPGPEARYEAREAVELVLLTCLERCRVSEGSRRSRVALGDDNVVAERHSVNDRTAGAR
jgi:RNA polymerase sigma-70 factor (ECF subfamily)